MPGLVDEQGDLDAVVEIELGHDAGHECLDRGGAHPKCDADLTRGASALAVLAVAGTVALAVAVARPETAPTPAGPAEGAHVVLVYGDLLNGADGPAENYSLVLNISTGEYQRMPYHTVVPSPDGTRLFVVDGDGTLECPVRMGILDRSTGDVSWLPSDQTRGESPQWSRDGSAILLVDLRATNGAPGFVLVDAATATATFVPFPDLEIGNSFGLPLSFTADGAGVLLAHTRAGSEADPNVLEAIDKYTLDGERISSVPLTVDDVLWATVSADGTRLLAVQRPEAGRSTIAVISVADGSMISTIEGLPTLPIAYADDEIVVLYDWMAYTFDGELIRKVDHPHWAPGGYSLYESIVVGSASGLPARAAHLTF